MKKSFLFAIIALVIIVALTFALTRPVQPKKSDIVGNKTLLSETLKLTELSLENKTTTEMLEDLKQKVESDDFATDLMNEAIWLQRFGEYHHLGHTLTYLALYIKDGSRSLCPGHEIEHVELFVKHNNFDLLNDTIQGIENSYQGWKEAAYAKKAQNPEFYASLDDVVKNVDQALAKIKAGNYNISSEVNFLTDNDVCA